MIEIKEGWTGLEAANQYEVRTLNGKIAALNRELEAALHQRARIQSACQHNHVSFSGQSMTCEVCTALIEN